jgi:hypothetical protein
MLIECWPAAVFVTSRGGQAPPLARPADLADMHRFLLCGCAAALRFGSCCVLRGAWIYWPGRVPHRTTRTLLPGNG